MGMALVMFLASCLMIISCINLTGAWKDQPKVIHVGGKVLCQDCSGGWNEWVHGAKPIKGGRVSLTCMDERSRVIYYGSDETDEQGEFEMVVDKFINIKELNPNLCSVRLLSSPDAACNVPTDFGGGKSGVKLGRPTFVYRDMVKYTPGPFYFTSLMCEEPDTTGSPYDDPSTNY